MSNSKKIFLSQDMAKQIATVDSEVSTLEFFLDAKSTAVSSEDLAKSVASIPHHIIAISFKNCNLAERVSTDPLATFIAAIPRSVTSLNVDGNALGESKYTLTTFLIALPRHIKHLSIRDNKLDKRDKNELRSAFQSTIAELTSLSLGHFSNFSDTVMGWGDDSMFFISDDSENNCFP